MAEAAIPIIQINRVFKHFQLQDQTIHALSDATLTIAKGEFVCLIGASGCGKSTLLRIMAGFEPPSSGQALMWDKPIEGPDPSRGMVFQDYALFPWLSVRDNIGFGPTSRGLARAEVKDTVDKFIELVGLQKFANAWPHQLSGGMKQQIGRAS
jgi:NitT/TauT family transport system ATP-binding protein